MPAFVNAALLWGMALVAIPVLIHLINLLRQRRVQWAAMEFLLASQRKNSSWIRLKELLLLLMRMAAVAALVLIVAQPLLTSEFGRRFGGMRTHHVILLDDSFSMTDRWADTSAFEQARQVVMRIGQQAAQQPLDQVFTLVRFSRANRGDGPQPDLLQEKINADFVALLEGKLQSIRPTQLNVGPEAALSALESLLGPARSEQRVVYLVSDYRLRQWDEPEQLRAALADLDAAGVELQLVNCVDAPRPNLAISHLGPRRGTLAAGVPIFMDVTVENFGPDVVRQVSVELAENGNPRPAVVIDEIAPGESQTRTFQVFFSTAGEHLVTARLQNDTVDADNHRYSLLNLPPAVPVLLVDGDPDLAHARWLATVFNPGGSVKTGIQPRIERPTFLNNNPLDEYRTIYVLNVDRLDQSAITALEEFARAGGGVGFFVGELTTPTFVTEALYRDGEGLFPLPLLAETQLLVDREATGSDIVVSNHPIFERLSGERNPYLSMVIVERYLSTTKGWSPAADSTVNILARLRNRAPLVVEQAFGEGRVVAVLTSVAPRWNNWSRNPSFVLLALELQSYLATPPVSTTTRLVGSSIDVELDPAEYQPQVRLVPPEADAASAPAVEATLDDGLLRASFNETLVAGEYQVRITQLNDQTETRRAVLNVDPHEGDLATVGSQELAVRLAGIDYRFRQAADFQFMPVELAGSNLSSWILYLLVLLLVGEQLLAYSASYHPSTVEAARR